MESYKVKFGNEPITQWEFPALYSIAVDKALSRGNLRSVFKKVGLFPLMSGQAWLAKYGTKLGINFTITKGKFAYCVYVGL